jgi:hypothetical protein
MKTKKMMILLFFSLLTVSTTTFSQQGYNKKWADTFMFNQRALILNTPAKLNFRSEQAIPQNYYTRQLGFFCRQELKMEQAHVPLTFRLGSMDDCNRLEQKPGYR